MKVYICSMAELGLIFDSSAEENQEEVLWSGFPRTSLEDAKESLTREFMEGAGYWDDSAERPLWDDAIRDGVFANPEKPELAWKRVNEDPVAWQYTFGDFTLLIREYDLNEEVR